ncbi:MAG TPA: hypothetical protein VNK95_11475 [Caldilineaceae bacterium]|nr:hypothetical protein [Caldilineaceae bacterium]
MLHGQRLSLSRGRRGRRRMVVLAAAVCVSLLLAGVAAAQVSQNFDLACRGVLDSAGSYRLYPNNALGLVDAVGQAGAGRSASSSYGLRAGYLQPRAVAVSADAATVDQGPWRLYMPIVYSFVRVVRACNW